MRRPSWRRGGSNATAADRDPARHRVRPGLIPPTPADRAGQPRRHLRRLITVICWSYPVLLTGVWGIQAGLGDRWWAATLLLYGPRWPWGATLVGLVPLAIWLKPQAVRPLLLAAVLLIGPVMGFCVPWRAFAAGDPDGPRLRVLSCNTQWARFDPRALGDLIDRVRPDVVALQEWSDAHRSEVFREPDWHFRVSHGLMLCVASRHPIRSAEPLGRELLQRAGYIVRYRLDAPTGPIVLVNLHLETPREGIEAVLSDGLTGAPALGVNIALRREVSAIAAELVEENGPPDVIVGDFNLTPDSTIFRRFWSHDRDAFSQVGFGLGYTKYTRWHGARIDHVLAGPDWQPAWCVVGPDVGSDHRPLIADLVRQEPPRGTGIARGAGR